MWPGFDSRTWRHIWVEFVVVYLPVSERVLPVLVIVIIIMERNSVNESIFALQLVL